MSKSKSNTAQRIAITPGEPAGIGPDICVAAFSDIREICEAVYFADPSLISDRAKLLGYDIPINNLQNNPFKPDHFNIQPIPLGTQTTPGQPLRENSAYVLETLTQALQQCVDNQCQALVTGPVNKSIIADAGYAFSGHTEWLAERTNTPQVVMMLAGGGLRVALATTHLPLSKVSDALSIENLLTTIKIIDNDLHRKFGITSPHLLVCGLNPHAGESGHLGSEEIDVIEPALTLARQQGINVTGPLPADTAFTHRHLEAADAVLAMYHDQGLPVLKYAAFGEAVNITLGLPIIRTSVDHGTAFDIAGTGQADAASLLQAVRCAVELTERR